MKRKLLFFDIDGTLAMPGKPISPAVREAIRTARSRGHLVFLSTGRPQWLVPSYITDIGFDGGIFHAGGRAIAGSEVILDQSMPQQLVWDILEMVRREPGLYFLLECPETCYRSDPEIFFSAAEQVEAEGAGTELRRLMQDLMNPGHRDEKDYQGERVYKISFFAMNRQQMEDVVGRLSGKGRALWFENLTMGFSMCSGEVTSFDTDKGRALRAICRHFGADERDSIAFGDSMNDAEMMTAAGEGIAMGNAEPRLKALAHRECESVEEDGVAKELARLGLA